MSQITTAICVTFIENYDFRLHLRHSFEVLQEFHQNLKSARALHAMNSIRNA